MRCGMNRITAVAITAMHAVTLGFILAFLGLTSRAGDSAERRPIYAYESVPQRSFKGLKEYRKSRRTVGASWSPRDPYLGFRPVTDPGIPDRESVLRGYRPVEFAAATPVQADVARRKSMPSAPLLKGLQIGQSVVEAIVR